MKNLIKNWGYVITSGLVGLVVALSIARCGSDASDTSLTYVQIERLARPAINEGLVRTNASLNAFNSIAPSIDLTAPAASVVSEAAVTLKALYAGACFINGALDANGLPPGVLTPGGLTCGSEGLAILGSGAIGLSAAFDAEATIYANRMAGVFLPDVMRIDTTVTSGYNAALCNAAAAGSPLLCGGRKLDDNVMDITYAFLLNGGAAPSPLASLRNGTYYSAGTTDVTCNVAPLSANCTNTGNTRQGHKAVAYATFPWGPAPY